MPTNYEQINDYSDELGTTHGLHLDEDFTAVASSITSVTESLALVQRGDGRLQDVSVEIHTLSQDVLNLLGGFNRRGLWATATAYAVNDIVSEGKYTYACKTAHTSGGAFDDTYWNQFGFTDGAASAYLRPVLKNCIINGNFQVNQRAYVSGAAVGTGLYGHDRWKMAASGDTYTYATALNVTTVTIPAGKVLQQVIEGNNLQSGMYTLSWTGTAQGKIGAGSYGDSGITGLAVGGTDLTIEFGPGTVSLVQFEAGATKTAFEFRPHGFEELLCKRYYEKSYNAATAPGTATTDGSLAFIAGKAGALSQYGSVKFSVEKRATPTTITYYSPASGSQVRDYTVGGVCTSTTTSSAGASGFDLTCTGNVATAVGNLLRVHWTAEAEL